MKEINQIENSNLEIFSYSKEMPYLNIVVSNALYPL
jgi:hypothetical protein